MNKFYVYAYFDEGVPIYIGKGQGDRWRRHLLGSPKTEFELHLRQMLVEGREPECRCVLKGVEEDEAFVFETLYIAAMGRRIDKTGPLFNQSWGGEGSVFGRTRTRAVPEPFGPYCVFSLAHENVVAYVGYGRPDRIARVLSGGRRTSLAPHVQAWVDKHRSDGIVVDHISIGSRREAIQIRNQWVRELQPALTAASRQNSTKAASARKGSKWNKLTRRYEHPPGARE